MGPDPTQVALLGVICNRLFGGATSAIFALEG